VQDFRELVIWKKAHELTLAVYQASRSFPREEIYGLTAQVRRSSASIPANLAEGCGRDSSADFARFCAIGMGSASETEYHLLLARDLRIISLAVHDELATKTTELKRMLARLIRNVRAPRN
jgi:four helix bundle protein